MAIQPTPLNNAVDVAGKSLSSVWAGWFNWLANYLKQVVDYTQTYTTTPTTGFSVTVPDNTQVVQLTPAGVLATGAVTTPANPFNGQTLIINTTKTVTSFTVTANAGQTVATTPTTLTSGSGVKYYYSSGSATWYQTA